MKDLLEAAGFTDITENEDGTVDATLGDYRYTKIHISRMSSPKIDGDVIIQDVDIKYHG